MHVLGLALLLALGDAAAGRNIFVGKGGCVDCHSVENRGGSVGPDLSEIGLSRSPESLRLALTDPNAEIYQQYFTVVAVTKQGKRIEGIALNEDDLSIQLRDTGDNLRSFLKDDIKEIRRDQPSLMPAYGSILSKKELVDLVAYLSSLRGAK